MNEQDERRELLRNLQDAIAYKAECEHEPWFLSAYNIRYIGNSIVFKNGDTNKQWRVTLTRVNA